MDIRKALSRNERGELAIHHVSAKRLTPGKTLEIELTVEKPVKSATLYYRHVNQAERFVVASMERNGSAYKATIPADYTNTPYPLQYYFEEKTTTGSPHLYRGFTKGLMNQPYFVVRRR